MYGLRLDGKLQSVHYCFGYKGKGYGYQGGWEPSLSRYGLGTLLTSFVLRDAIAEGMYEFDFLSGSESYKAHWTKDQRYNMRLVGQKPDIRSEMAGFIYRTAKRHGRSVKLMLDRCRVIGG